MDTFAILYTNIWQENVKVFVIWKKFARFLFWFAFCNIWYKYMKIVYAIESTTYIHFIQRYFPSTKFYNNIHMYRKNNTMDWFHHSIFCLRTKLRQNGNFRILPASEMHVLSQDFRIQFPRRQSFVLKTFAWHFPFIFAYEITSLCIMIRGSTKM